MKGILAEDRGCEENTGRLQFIFREQKLNML